MRTGQVTAPLENMTKIRALRQFSHYHAGNFDQHEERFVDDSVAEALVSMDLAEVVVESRADSSKPEADPKKKVDKK